jgi:t-SNARE complex subunit (syntaxin)
VTNVENYTEEAKVDLGDALDSQKSIQKKKWLMIVLVIILIIVILMALAYIAKNLGITKAFASKKKY